MVLKQQREKLLQTLSRDIKDERVLNAIKQVPREEFVPEYLREYAYLDTSFNIGYGQSISQPYIVGLMTELLELKESDIVLDIGGGTGYQAAILSKLCKEVISIEIVSELAQSAKERLKRLGFKNVLVIEGDGKDGYLPKSPYDKILCAAVSESIPPKWRDQLKDGGIIVLPLYIGNRERLVRARKIESGYSIESITNVRFVQLV